jgi:hypothetical protein
VAVVLIATAVILSAIISRRRERERERGQKTCSSNDDEEKAKRKKKRKVVREGKQFLNVKVGSGCAVGMESSSFPLFVAVKKKKDKS